MRTLFSEPRCTNYQKVSSPPISNPLFFFSLKLIHYFGIAANPNDEELTKLITQFRSLFDKFLSSFGLDSHVTKNLKEVSETTPISTLVDMLAPVWQLNLSEKLALLETVDLKKKVKLTMDHLSKRLSSLRPVQRKLFTPNHFAGQQSMSEEEGKEMEELKSKIEEANLPEESKKKVDRQLSRLQRLKPSSAEYDILRTYLELVADVKFSQKLFFLKHIFYFFAASMEQEHRRRDGHQSCRGDT